MEVPDAVGAALGDEDIRAGVSLGDGDLVCFTETRSLVYRSEGLLSDESVSAYPHGFERLEVSEGRRKTTLTFTYVDGEESLSIPANRTEPVLERVLEGTLGEAGVLEADESVAGVFRFSELTLVVAQRRLVKHVGGYTWDGDFQQYPFEAVTGLSFEEGSVATSVVLEAGERSERIKAPNERARAVRATLEEALFEFFDVDSLGELNRTLEGDPADDAEREGLALESDIDPLVGETGADGATEEGAAGDASRRGAGPRGEPGDSREPDSDGSGTPESAPSVSRDQSESRADLTTVTDQLAALTETVERQTDLLERQQETIDQLIEELRRGR